MVNRLEIEEVTVTPRAEAWRTWPVSWSAAWVGTLTSLAVLMILGLIGVAVGSHLIGPSARILSWREFGWLALAYSIAGAFFSFVAGGWVSARVAGIYRAEPAMLHGAIAWLIAVPALFVLVGLGGNAFLGPWYGGLAGIPAWTQAAAPKTTVAPVDDAAKIEAENAARATRNSALGAVTALLLGLIGSVLGGWMASGEPMHFGQHYRTRAGTERLNVPART
jgi:uncharacterized membrane protein YeaQ/YmgE (transglycosylase-associated protein family)